MRLSPLVQGIQLSVTLALDARAKAMAAAGRDVLNMAVGEPDFRTPAAATAAARARVETGEVRYTPAAGTVSLRRAIAAHLEETRGVSYATDEITVCHSCKHALSGALFALVAPGDEVVVPLPAWVSYVDLIRAAGGVPVLVPPRPADAPGSGCRPDLEALAAAITPRTSAILVNSPSNPSGYVWAHEESRAIGALAAERGLALISDEIYRRLVYEGDPALSPASTGDAARAQTVIVDGASKSFAMTGYRVGFLAGPADVADAVARLHSQTTGAPNTVSQEAYEAALVSEPPEVEAMCAEFGRRREVLVAGLAALGLDTPRPRGAFYAFPDVGRLLDERGSVGFCADLLEGHGLALVPGSAFGMDRHVRLSYATSIERIGEALARLEAFLGARRVG